MVEAGGSIAEGEVVITWAWTARWKAPRLKGSMEPLWFLVPSGKTQTRTWGRQRVKKTYTEGSEYGCDAVMGPLRPHGPASQLIYNCSAPQCPRPSFSTGGLTSWVSRVWATSDMTLMASPVRFRSMKMTPASQHASPAEPAHSSSRLAMGTQRPGSTSIIPRVKGEG